MKKILCILMLVFGVSFVVSASNVNSQDKKTYSSGKVVVSGSGRYYEIIDNVNNVCIYLEIEEEKTSRGTFYHLMCENKVTKNVAKTALKGAVASIVTAATSPSAAAAPAIGAVAWDIAGGIYDEVCDYYGNR